MPKVGGHHHVRPPRERGNRILSSISIAYTDLRRQARRRQERATLDCIALASFARSVSLRLRVLYTSTPHPVTTLSPLKGVPGAKPPRMAQGACNKEITAKRHFLHNILPDGVAE